MRQESIVLPAFVTQHAEGAVLAVRVSPRSQPNGIGPIEADVVRIRVGAAAVDGAANVAMVRMLAEKVGVPKSTIEIIAGQSSRGKRILFRGLTATELLRRLPLDRDKT